MEAEVIGRLRAFLRATKGKMMHVSFTKRSTGELREMTCRTGVRKHKVDPTSEPDPLMIAQDKKHALLRVFDINAEDKKRPGQKGAYRICSHVSPLAGGVTTSARLKMYCRFLPSKLLLMLAIAGPPWG